MSNLFAELKYKKTSVCIASLSNTIDCHYVCRLLCPIYPASRLRAPSPTLTTLFAWVHIHLCKSSTNRRRRSSSRRNSVRGEMNASVSAFGVAHPFAPPNNTSCLFFCALICGIFMCCSCTKYDGILTDEAFFMRQTNT